MIVIIIVINTLINGAKTMSYYSHVGMVNIPAIKMLMTGGWFVIVLPILYTIFYISFNLGDCKRHDFLGHLAGSILSKVATSSEFKPEDVRCSARRGAVAIPKNARDPALLPFFLFEVVFQP